MKLHRRGQVPPPKSWLLAVGAAVLVIAVALTLALSQRRRLLFTRIESGMERPAVEQAVGAPTTVIREVAALNAWTTNLGLQCQRVRPEKTGRQRRLTLETSPVVRVGGFRELDGEMMVYSGVPFFLVELNSVGRVRHLFQCAS
jgi:hypothetical protein